ncbi:TetR/AcrR family transcriptional regulator [Mannheimia haemolytica]|nr:TetR/AcrR family transcriptional regulator [Mannheimia haemolytica]STY62578.1 Bacterial regulatory proteins, tetR family [Mannheimia haemolytica]
MTTAPVGRPRDEELTEKVLATTYQMLAEQEYAEISLVKIAERAGVSRKALYSRWSNKCELVIEAFNLFNPPTLPPLQTSIKAKLLAYIEQSVAVINQNSALFRNVLADILAQPKSFEFFETAFSLPRQQVYQHLIQQGIENGEFEANTDIPLVSECLSAIFRQRILQEKKIDIVFIEKVVEMLLG